MTEIMTTEAELKLQAKKTADMKQYQKEYRLRNKEKIKRLNAEYKQKNSEKMKQYGKEYRENMSPELKNVYTIRHIVKNTVIDSEEKQKQLEKVNRENEKLLMLMNISKSKEKLAELQAYIEKCEREVSEM